MANNLLLFFGIGEYKKSRHRERWRLGLLQAVKGLSPRRERSQPFPRFSGL